MTLDHFITTKPHELRLGQYFYNTYLYRLKPEDRQQHETLWFYNSTDDRRVIAYIKLFMENNQWTELENEY